MKKYLKETAKYTLRIYPVIRKYIKEIDALYNMSAKELYGRNEQQFIEIFRKAYNDSSFYHKLYSDAGIAIDDIKCLDDIKKLPILTKDMVKEHGEEMLTVSKKKLIANHSSGTTGTPLTVWESWNSIWREQAYLYCYRKRCGFTYGQPLVSLRGNLDRKETYMKVHISNTLFLSSYNINTKTIKLYYDKIITHKPVAIEGYPSSLYSLAMMMNESGLQVNIPVAFTSSETLLDYQRDLIEEVLGTHIYDHYGMTERCIMLLESKNHNGYYEAPGYSINEYREDGEICTSLINKAFPLIRYKCNDVIEQSNGQIYGIRGRIAECIIGKDGSRYSGAALTYFVKGIPNILGLQLVQKEKGKMSVHVIPDQGFDMSGETVKAVVNNQIGLDNIDYDWKVIDPNELIYSKSGKLSLIYTTI